MMTKLIVRNDLEHVAKLINSLIYLRDDAYSFNFKIVSDSELTLNFNAKNIWK